MEPVVRHPRAPSATSRDTDVALLQPRPPVERNLNLTDFPPPPPLPRIPTTDEVMDDLREVTYQYVNCPDPTESAARRQRVLDGEANGLMEETAARIIAQAKETAGASSSQAVGEENMTRHGVLRLLSPANEESLQVQATLPALPRGEGRPPAPKRRTTLSRHLNGSVSRKNNLSRTQRLSGTGNGRDTTVGPSRRTPRSSIRRSNAPRQRRSTQITPSPNLHPPNASSPDIAAGQRRIRSELQDEQQGDFHSPYPKLP